MYVYENGAKKFFNKRNISVLKNMVVRVSCVTNENGAEKLYVYGTVGTCVFLTSVI